MKNTFFVFTTYEDLKKRTIRDKIIKAYRLSRDSDYDLFSIHIQKLGDYNDDFQIEHDYIKQMFPRIDKDIEVHYQKCLNKNEQVMDFNNWFNKVMKSENSYHQIYSDPSDKMLALVFDSRKGYYDKIERCLHVFVVYQDLLQNQCVREDLRNLYMYNNHERFDLHISCFDTDVNPYSLIYDTLPEVKCEKFDTTLVRCKDDKEILDDYVSWMDFVHEIKEPYRTVYCGDNVSPNIFHNMFQYITNHYWRNYYHRLYANKSWRDAKGEIHEIQEMSDKYIENCIDYLARGECHNRYIEKELFLQMFQSEYAWRQSRKSRRSIIQTIKEKIGNIALKQNEESHKDTVRRLEEKGIDIDELPTLQDFMLHKGDDSNQKEVETPQNDNVNHPSHYANRKYEPINVISDWKLDFLLGNTVKYISRLGLKDAPKQDINKALFYLIYKCKKLGLTQEEIEKTVKQIYTMEVN